MSNKLKNFFKMNTWKRWFILVFIFLVPVVFVCLSFGLKSKDTKFSNDYKSGISLTINPVNDNGTFLDESYSKQLLSNLKTRLENNYKNSFIEANYEKENVWNVNITNIDPTNIDQVNDVISFISDKKALTLLPINSVYNPSFYNSTINNNSLFNNSNFSNNSYSLSISSNNSKNFYDWAKRLNLGDKVIIWKNFQILNDTVKYAVENEGYSGTLYEYLFVNKRTPENKDQIDNGNNSTLDSFLFKEEIIGREWNEQSNEYIIKGTYKATDFIVSKNDLSLFSADSSNSIKNITISKDFGVSNSNLTNEQINEEYQNVSFWISTYKFNNFILQPKIASNGNNSYVFLLVALISFFILLSIFVVLNYGYLGIFAILILAMLVALAFLMISILFGDYNSISIIVILITLFISTDFIVTFLERVKREYFKGNIVSKSIKNTISNVAKDSYLKSLLLVFLVGIIYLIIGTLLNQFSTIILITSLAILLLLNPLLFGVSKIFSNLSLFASNSKSIGLWSKKYQKFHYNERIINDEKNDQKYDDLDLASNENISNELISEDVLNFNKKDHKRFLLYKKNCASKSILIVILTFAFLSIFTICSFLINFFVGGKSLTFGLNISNNDQQNIVLRIAKKDNQDLNIDEINNIKKILNNKNINESQINLVDNKAFEIYLNKDYSKLSINEITQELTNLYNLTIISSELINSDTFKTMLNTLYGILASMILMCIFVLMWMNWSKALVLFIYSIINIVVLGMLLISGILQLGSILSVAILSLFIIFSLFVINILIRVNSKIKVSRIEQMDSNQIKELIYKQVYKTIKPLTITNIIIFFGLILFLCFIGSIPTMFLIFMLIALFVNFVFIFTLLPKLLIRIELLRSKIKRKIIIDNYWDTEKVKEQNFKGINDIK